MYNIPGSGNGLDNNDINNLKYSYQYTQIVAYNDKYWNAYNNDAYKLSAHMSIKNSLYNRIIAELVISEVHH